METGRPGSLGRSPLRIRTGPVRSRPMLNWELLTAALDARRGTPMFVQLSEALAGDIRSGRLKPGDPLPGNPRARHPAPRPPEHDHRRLQGADVAQGLVEARRGGGTFVSGQALSTFEDVAGSTPASRVPTYAVPPPPRPLPLTFRPIPVGVDALPRGARRAAVPGGGPVARLPQRPVAATAGSSSATATLGATRISAAGSPPCSPTPRALRREENVMVTRGSQQAI